jgi:hypothetical protein
VWWGKGSTMGSFVPVFHLNETDYQLFAVFTHESVEIYFQWLQYKPPFDSEDLRMELRSRLNEIPNVSISSDAITRRPNFPFATLSSDASLSRFLEVMDWALEQIKAT